MNQLFYGDNLTILQHYGVDESVDLIYLDPPWNKKVTYNVLFAERNGSRSPAQIKAFGDTWTWDQAAVASYEEIVEAGGRISRAMQAFRHLVGENDMLAYLTMMAPRLVELKRVLKPTGSIYLHCDPTASHYLKLLMDAVFSPKQFQNEIIWHYTGGGRSKRYFSRKHDILFWYCKGRYPAVFNIDAVRVPYKETSGYAKGGIVSRAGKRYLPNTKGTPVDDVWDIPIINPLAKERLGYPTQKPEILLERVIKASSNEGDLVLDPFCGCGTTVAVAQRLNRRWIGIDVTHLAINLIKHRLLYAFGSEIFDEYETIGEPTDLPGAVALAQEDRYQFQWWALGLVGARPTDPKKGSDQGIDGRIYFHDEPRKGKTKQIVLSVKSGTISVRDIRDLRGVMEREEAEIGVFITLQRPTKPMRQEAAGVGLYTSPWGKHPRLQILTIEELIEDKGIDYPPSRQVDVTFKKSPRVKRGGKTIPLPLPPDEQ